MQNSPRLPLAMLCNGRTIRGMRTPRFAWLNIANGVVVVLLMWRWAYSDDHHDLLHAATMWALMIGFSIGTPAALRSLRTAEEPPRDASRDDALMLFPAEASDDDVVGAPVRVTADRPAWYTVATHGVLMIALSWRWAFRDAPYTLVDAVTLSILMMGFVGASATIVKSLGRPAQSRTMIKQEQTEELFLFPAEDSAPNDLALTPQLLATGRKALL